MVAVAGRSTGSLEGIGMSLLERFRQGDRWSQLVGFALLAVAVAFVGGGLGFVADAIDAVWLLRVAVVIVTVAIGAGALACIAAFVMFPGELRRNLASFRERQRSTWRHDEWRP